MNAGGWRLGQYVNELLQVGFKERIFFGQLFRELLKSGVGMTLQIIEEIFGTLFGEFSFLHEVHLVKAVLQLSLKISEYHVNQSLYYINGTAEPVNKQKQMI